MSKRTQRRAEQRRIAKLAHNGAPGAPASPAADAPPPNPTATDAQITANRENATHSTGPKTEAGREAVSQNRRVHGLNYNAATFTVLACENQSDYDHLLASLNAEHKPESATESLLLTSMAQHRWLLDRATRLQQTCFDPATAAATDQKLLTLYLRYATTHERAFHKCLNDLLKLRKEERLKQFGFESQKRQNERHGMGMWVAELKGLHLKTKPPSDLTDEEFNRYIDLAGLTVKKAA